MSSVDNVDSDEERIPNESNLANLTKELPQGSDKTNVVLDGLLDSLPTK